MPEPQITKASFDRFNAGQPGQGFIGIVDIETNQLHLYPAFHKQDGMAKEDIHGNKLTSEQYVETSVQRGKQAILSAHGKAATILLGRNESMRKINEGKLLGFGLWKAGIPLLIKNEADYKTEMKQYVPNEYVLVKRGNQYRLYYVENNDAYDIENNDAKEFIQIEIDIASIKNQISRILENNIGQISSQKRKKILDLIKSVDLNRNPKIKDGVKYFKTSSTSLNPKSTTYDPLYMCYFIFSVGGHLDHAQGAIRELKKETALNIISPLMKVGIITSTDVRDFVSYSQLDHWSIYDEWYSYDKAKQINVVNADLASFLIENPNNIRPLYRFFKDVWDNNDKYNLRDMPNLFILSAISANDTNGIRQALEAANENLQFTNIHFELISKSDTMKQTFENWVLDKITNDDDVFLRVAIIQQVLENLCIDDNKTDDLRKLLVYVSKNHITGIKYDKILQAAYQAKTINNIKLIYSVLQKTPGFIFPTAHHLAMLGKVDALRQHLQTNGTQDLQHGDQLLGTTVLKCAIKSNNPETVTTVLKSIDSDEQMVQMLTNESQTDRPALFHAIMSENPDIYNGILEAYNDQAALAAYLCQLLQEYLHNSKKFPAGYGKHLILITTFLCLTDAASNVFKSEVFDIVAKFYVAQKTKMPPNLRSLLQASMTNLENDTYKNLLTEDYTDTSTSILHMAALLEDFRVVAIIMDSIPDIFRMNYLSTQDSQNKTPLLYCLDQRVNINVLNALLKSLNRNDLSSLFSEPGVNRKTIFHNIAEGHDIKLLQYISSDVKPRLSHPITHYLSMEDQAARSPLYLATLNTDQPAMVGFMVSILGIPPGFCSSGTGSSQSLLRNIIDDDNTQSFSALLNCYQEEADKMALIFDDAGLIDYMIDNKKYAILHVVLLQIENLQPANMTRAMQIIKSKFIKPNVLSEYVFNDTTLVERAQRLTLVSTLIPASKSLLKPLIKQLSKLTKPGKKSKPSSVVISSTSFQPLNETDITRAIADALVVISNVLNRTPAGP